MCKKIRTYMPNVLGICPYKTLDILFKYWVIGRQILEIYHVYFAGLSTLTQSYFSRTKWMQSSSTIIVKHKLFLCFKKEVDIWNIITILSC